MISILQQYSAATIQKYISLAKSEASEEKVDSVPIQFEPQCAEMNICSMMSDTLFEEYICCLENEPDTVDTLTRCEVFMQGCCDSSINCCPGESYQTNPNCDCNPLTECCDLWGDEDFFPANLNCVCVPDPLGKYCCPD